MVSWNKTVYSRHEETFIMWRDYVLLVSLKNNKLSWKHQKLYSNNSTYRSFPGSSGFQRVDSSKYEGKMRSTPWYDFRLANKTSAKIISSTTFVWQSSFITWPKKWYITTINCQQFPSTQLQKYVSVTYWERRQGVIPGVQNWIKSGLWYQIADEKQLNISELTLSGAIIVL